MEFFEYDNNIEQRINLYNSSYFHIYLEGESPINNVDFNNVSVRDFASFIHEYIHYIQQITTPYGIKYNSYFNNNLILLREFIDSNDAISLPLRQPEEIEPAKALEQELKNKNGSKYFNKGNIDDIEINELDISNAELEDKAVNIGVYDFENNRAFDTGFQFGYWCVLESMAHLVQLLINPDLYHTKVPYESAQMICKKVRPELAGDTKILISICYTALFFNNPGVAFFKILKDVKSNENGIELYQRYMRDYSRIFMGETMPNYKMMHRLMDDFVGKLETLIGNESLYIRKVMENCKIESSRGESELLKVIYSADMKEISTLNELIDFFGFPAIDSKSGEVVFPFNPETNRPYIETASLLSLELITTRLREKDNQKICARYPICNRTPRASEIIDEGCAEVQWEKESSCLFTMGLSYWRMKNKKFK